ncbi:MAG: hypothetical protein LBG71_05800 [Clostridiales Family XIII bacterium]|jgi:hypothetical protein|nr:hypothetical protein [Clostridiales Family XIII bacterium]
MSLGLGRIKNVADFKKHPRASIMAAAALAAALTAGLAACGTGGSAESGSPSVGASDIELWRTVHIGASYDAVHELLGEPDGATSGIYGERYALSDGTAVYFTYDDSSRVSRVRHGDGWTEEFLVAPVDAGGGAYPETLASDWDGWHRISGNGKILVSKFEGAVQIKAFCAQIGTEQAPRLIAAAYEGEPMKYDMEMLSVDFPVADAFPKAFLGQVWAVATLSDGTEYQTEMAKAVYEPDKTSSPANGEEPVLEIRGPEAEGEPYSSAAEWAAGFFSAKGYRVTSLRAIDVDYGETSENPKETAAFAYETEAEDGQKARHAGMLVLARETGGDWEAVYW